MKRKQAQPWERLPKESDPAWEAFVTYRDMPEETGLKRSSLKVAKKLGKSQTIISRWSYTYNWVERCSAYDAYMDELAIAERIKKQKKRIQDEEKMDERHIGLAVQLQKMLLEAMKAADITEMSPKGFSELSKAITNAANLERASRHATHADRQLELNREQFEYKKQQDAGENVEYEDLEEVEAEIYGESDMAGGNPEE